MLTEEFKQKALDDLSKVTCDELISFFELVGSEKIENGTVEDIDKFIESEIARCCQNDWVESACGEPIKICSENQNYSFDSSSISLGAA